MPWLANSPHHRPDLGLVGQEGDAMTVDSHIVDPGTLREIKLREVEDEILTEAYRQLSAKGKTIAGQVASQVSDEMRDDAVRLVLGMSTGGDSRLQLPGPAAQVGQSTIGASVVGAAAHANGTSERAKVEAPKG